MKKFFVSLFLLSTIIFGSQPYVILVSFDGFRWDYVNRGITPGIQEMINEGVHAVSLQPSFPSKTFPNHYSIITGLYPQDHGIISNGFTNYATGKKFSMRSTENYWWIGRAFWERAQDNGILSATYFWPGSRLDDTTRRPTYSKEYDRDTPYKNRIDSLISWLQYSLDKRPHFLSIYFEETDDYGHKYGPNSPEINIAIKRCDSLVAYLRNKLNNIGMKDSVNIILTSDHGMTEISEYRIINIEELLKGLDYQFSDSGPFMLIQPSEKDKDKIKNILEADQTHYKFYLRKDVPEYLHYSESSRIPDFVLIADLGWYLARNKDIENWGGYSSAATHGYDNHEMDMHGLFVASGPAFKSGYKTGTIWNIDIYPLINAIFGLPENENIDGKLDRIGFLLK